jgi:hypothetical protein
MEPLTERLLNDFACLDPIYVDGIAGVLNLGENFGTLFYRWSAKLTSGVVSYERLPAMTLIRPRASLVCGPHSIIASMLDSQEPPAASDRRALLRAMQ